MTRPNPLTDELSDDAKAELAAIFAEMKARYRPRIVWERRIVNGRVERVRRT
ncbi:hypothetical protein [Mycobacterium ostraviense]|uniref:hypothetical protein n=1 Tax=Mycobacterium ostraviense TaxID=2738409 RepID=UPI000B23951B|nr:hypothetical protein [Mycobacterium ostraviense]